MSLISEAFNLFSINDNRKNENFFNEIRNLAHNRLVSSLAESYGNKIMNVSWEDTSRYVNSSFGSNISDLTLNVKGQNMPLIRKPNFADITSDQDIGNFNLIVGNENNTTKQMISLETYLKNIGKYTNNPNIKSMFRERDNKILTSAQACVLPLENGEVEFNIKLYNYQSQSEPAVLIIVVSSEGTSTQIVNGRNCTLYFNKDGKNANFIAERLSEDRKKCGVSVEGAMTNEEKQRNAILIFQIPLKIKRAVIKSVPMAYSASAYSASASSNQLEGCFLESDGLGKFSRSALAIPVPSCGTNKKIGFENAVIKTGGAFGSYLGTAGKTLERDEDSPIRCTIQYYKVTDTTDINESMIKEISEQINRQYNSVDDSKRGSLVVGDSDRITKSEKSINYQFNNSSLVNNL